MRCRHRVRDDCARCAPRPEARRGEGGGGEAMNLRRGGDATQRRQGREGNRTLHAKEKRRVG